MMIIIANCVWLNHRWTEIVNEQADTHSEAGQSSECATDVSHSPGVQPSPQCPAPPPTAWQSTEVPDDQTENDDSNEWVKNIVKLKGAKLLYLCQYTGMMLCDCIIINVISIISCIVIIYYLKGMHPPCALNWITKPHCFSSVISYIYQQLLITTTCTDTMGLSFQDHGNS